MEPYPLDQWNAEGLAPTDLLPYCRGWRDTEGGSVIYCPTQIAIATSDLPLSGDRSLDAYLDLVLTTWAAEFHAIRNEGCTPDEAVDVAIGVIDTAPGAAEFLTDIAVRHMDELLGGPPE